MPAITAYWNAYVFRKLNETMGCNFRDRLQRLRTGKLETRLRLSDKKRDRIERHLHYRH